MGAKLLYLPTEYRPAERLERPVRRHRIAEQFGVCTKTVDLWVSRDGMPQDICWIMVGHQRRYYPSRVREWLAMRDD